MFDRILVVCVGNICRSPTGERLLRRHLPGHAVESAGLAALVGQAADSTACAVAKENALDLSGHHARPLTAELCQQFDLILVMEQVHISGVCKLFPAARSKTMLFGQWLDSGQRNIADPYRQSTDMFRHVYEHLAQAADLWAAKLRRIH